MGEGLTDAERDTLWFGSSDQQDAAVARIKADAYQQGRADLAARVEALVADYSAHSAAMKPDDYRTGQDHLPPAFREINFRAAFMALGELSNGFEADLRAILTADATPTDAADGRMGR